MTTEHAPSTDNDRNKAMREWALRCAFDERDVAWINRLYPEIPE